MTGAPQSNPVGDEAVGARLEDVARSSHGRLLAYLAAATGDIAGAEDALAEAFVAALTTWPTRGVPDRPDSWLLTAARRNLIDDARRRDTARRAAPDVARLLEQGADPAQGSVIPDVRLQLMFACSHPAIDAGIRSPLMLQTVLGLDAARIGTVFLVEPAAMGQRLVRAKVKIKRAGVPFRVPADGDLPERVGAVLDAVYAAYTAGWDDLALPLVEPLDGHALRGETTPQTELAAEAVRLARLVAMLLPQDPEAAGLLALLLHSHARRDARRALDGSFVPLRLQDTSRWSRPLMEEAERHLTRATTAGRLGPYQLMAAIQSVHALRAVSGTTDTHTIYRLYDGLAHLNPSVGVLVARAAAALADGRPAQALQLLDDVPTARVTGYQPFWVTRTAVLDALSDPATAEARTRALRLTSDPAVQAHLRAH